MTSGAKFCAWHEAGQGILTLPGVLKSHGICPICKARIQFDLMKHDAGGGWIQLVIEGGWQQVHLGGYWVSFRREHDGQVQWIKHGWDSGPLGSHWFLTVSGVRVFEGDLSECLERAEISSVR